MHMRISVAKDCQVHSFSTSCLAYGFDRDSRVVDKCVEKVGLEILPTISMHLESE